MIPEADPRVTKEEFAYVEDDTPLHCGSCNMFYNNKCTLVKGDIDGVDGICTFWAKRRTKPISGKKYTPMLDKKAAGYIEVPNGTSCGTCKFFHNRTCEMVMGDIDPLGCCIVWTANEDTEDRIISNENYKKIFKFYGQVKYDD